MRSALVKKYICQFVPYNMKIVSWNSNNLSYVWFLWRFKEMHNHVVCMWWAFKSFKIPSSCEEGAPKWWATSHAGPLHSTPSPAIQADPPTSNDQCHLFRGKYSVWRFRIDKFWQVWTRVPRQCVGACFQWTRCGARRKSWAHERRVHLRSTSRRPIRSDVFEGLRFFQ